MSAVGAVGGGGAAAAAGGGSAAVGAAGAVGAGAGTVSGSASVGDSEGVAKAVGSDGADPTQSSHVAPIQPGQVGMSSQDFVQLRQSCVQPPQEAPEMDLNKMLQWLIAIKMLEAMDGGK